MKEESDTGTPAPKGNAPAAASGKGGGNLLGRINNLATTDLKSITQARDFMLLGQSIAGFLRFTSDSRVQCSIARSKSVFARGSCMQFLAGGMTFLTDLERQADDSIL